MRVLVGLMALLAGAGVTMVFLPPAENRPRHPEAGAAGDLVGMVNQLAHTLRHPTVRRPLATAESGPSVPATTVSRSLDEPDTSAPAADFDKSSASTPETRTHAAVPISQLPLRALPPKRLASSKPADAEARRQLTRELQRELRRVGCYDGEIDGTWGPGSKRAMIAFTERVNATLPVEEPDYILLALLQSHAAQTCGQTCPRGQELADDGRCLPLTMMARNVRKGADRIEEPAAHSGQPLPDQRVAGAVVQREAERGWKAMVPPGERETPPGVSGAPSPMPGRMAAGVAGDGREPQPAGQHDRADTARQDPLAQQEETTATERPGTLESVKKHPLGERRRDGRLSAADGSRFGSHGHRFRDGRASVARAPHHVHRAPAPAYRTARRYYAPRPSYAALWRRWQYAIYGGYGGYGGYPWAWR
jgi:hypothetical protein